jgi:hypothetical protein
MRIDGAVYYSVRRGMLASTGYKDGCDGFNICTRYMISKIPFHHEVYEGLSVRRFWRRFYYHN